MKSSAPLASGCLVRERVLSGRGIAWLDMGTHESFVQATNFIRIIEQRQGLKIACLEEIAFRTGYISKQKLEEVAQSMRNSTYGDYLQRLLTEY